MVEPKSPKPGEDPSRSFFSDLFMRVDLNTPRGREKLAAWMTVWRTLYYAIRTLASVLAAVIFAALFGVGFWLIMLALVGLLGIGVDVALTPMAALVGCLKGLEFLFLAPLPLLTVLGIGTYVEKFFADPSGTSVGADLTPLKSLVTSLMIAIIATDAVAKVVSTEPMTYEAALTRAGLIVALVIYYFGLHGTPMHTKGHPPT